LINENKIYDILKCLINNFGYINKIDMWYLYEIFQPKKKIGVAIGDKILNLNAIANYFDGPLLKDKQDVFRSDYLNDFMSLGRPAWLEARSKLQNLLSADNHTLQDAKIQSK